MCVQSNRCSPGNRNKKFAKLALVEFILKTDKVQNLSVRTGLVLFQSHGNFLFAAHQQLEQLL